MGSIKKSIRRAIWCSPAVYFPALRILRSANRIGLVPKAFAPPESFRARGVVDRQTDLVIEGFPRSGNSFAVAAMQLAQSKPLRLAHHFHVPAQVVFACRHSIPLLVILRQAVDAVISQMIRTPSGRLDQGLMDWISFYECIRPYRDGFVLADFEDIIEDFGAVTDRINAKFGTEFNRFDHSAQNCEEVFRRIEEWNAIKHGRIEESTIARPSLFRREIKQRFLNKLEDKKYAELLQKADSVYQSLSSGGS